MNKNYSKRKISSLSSKPSTAIQMLLMVLFVSVTPLIAFGQSQTFDSSGNFSVPAGVTSITVQAWGAGGAGGGSTNAGSNVGRGGAGGGGGAYATVTIPVTPFTTLPVIVGAGGTGVSGANGNAGASSTITGYTGLILAQGGRGGSANTNTSGGSPAGGAGGAVSASIGSPIAGFNGVNGATATSPSVAFSGAGGAGANSGGAGGAGIGTAGTTSNGNPGIQAGGGGGGARTSQNNNNRTGGNGAAGRIIITWCPIYSLTSVAATDACEATKTSTVTLRNTTAANLPVGTYTVSYTLYGSPRSAPMAVTMAGTGVFTADVNGISPTSSTSIIITRLEMGSCSSTVNNTSNSIYMHPNIVSTYNLNSYDSGSCTSVTVQWQNIGDNYVSNYYLDVSTASDFSTFLPTYNNRNMGTSFSQLISGLTTSTTYYYRVRTANFCGTSPSVSSSFTLGSVGGIANSSQAISTNTAPSDVNLTGYQGAIQWQVSTNNSSFTDISGASGATLTSAQMGVLTATRYYRAKVVYGNCAISYSPTVTVAIVPIITTGIVICEGGAGSLIATGTCGSTTTPALKNAGSGTNETGSGTINWSDPGRIVSDNDSGATASVGINSVQTTNYLQGKGFGFSIPSNATITGIQVSINRYSNRNDNVRYIQDAEVKLIKANTIIGNDKSVTGKWSLDQTTVMSYGGTTDLWGSAWTPADIEDVNFGVALAVTITRTGMGSTTANVDNIQITVTYVIEGVEWYTTSSGGTAIATGLSFNPVGVPGSGLVNTNTAGTTTYYAACSNNPDFRVPANFVINAAPSIPQAEISQPTCIVSTGSVVLSGLPATGTWTLYQDGTSIGTGTGATTTVKDLAPGTYEFTVGVASCLSPGSGSIVIKPLPLVATYNGGWTNGPPTIEQSIVFEGNYTSIGNLEGCDCTVNSGVQVTVQSGHTLKITNAVKVNTATGTSLTFQDDASLVQVNDDALNTGNISYSRINSTTSETDYTYWSSPVAGQKLYEVSPNTPPDFFYLFNAEEDNWNYAGPSTVMDVGTGYIIRGPKIVGTPPLTFHEATFKGTPNNGKIELSGIIKDRSYLLGNPYPSALSANKFITDNSAVLDGTLYFWTHMTPIGDAVFNPGSGVYAYSSNDYATYNLTGGLATNPGSAASQSVSDKPTGEIAAGQAFFTSSRLDPTNNTIVFNNRMRLDVNDAIMDNSQFFKVNNSTKKTNTIEKHRVWLNLTNTQGAFKQMLVGYITGATNDYDSSFDGPSYNGNEFIDFYSISDNESLAIQGRALPFDENDSVLLGYSSAIEGDFSISIDEVDGLLVGQNIYLEDKLNNSIHNLTKEAYTFETSKGTFDDRFVLRYTDKTLGTGDFDTINMQVLVSVKNKQIKINSAVESIDKVMIFDILGKQILSKINVGTTELVIPNLGSSEQVLIVKTLLQNGQTVTTKLIY